MKRAFRKFLVSILAISLALSAFAGIALAAASVYATDGDTYIRSQPNLSGKLLGTLHEGASANYLGNSSTDNRGVKWYKISYKGTTGWVSSRYTTLSSKKPSKNTKVYATEGDTYIRSQPNLSGKRLAVFPEGATANYSGSTSTDSRGVKWYKISYQGTSGWVSSRYTSFTKASSKTKHTVRASEGDSYIRSQPNLSGKRLALFPSGASASYAGNSSTDSRGVKWYKITYKGTTGWVSSKYTTLR